MSAGNQVVPIRIDADLMAEVRECIRHRNEVSANAPWTFSDFVRTAVREKLAHMRRSRTRAKKQASATLVVNLQSFSPPEVKS